MRTRAGIRGGRQLANTFRKMGDAPTPAMRAKAREEALKITTTVAGTILTINRSVHEGALKASLGVAPDRAKRNRTLAGPLMGTFHGYEPATISHLVEFPVRPHWQPRRFGGIMHPGHPGYPFMRPAIDYTREPVARAYFTSLSIIVIQAAVNSGGMRRGQK